MKNSTSFLLLIIAVLSFIVWAKSCKKDPEEEPRVIVVAPVSAVLEAKAPTYTQPEKAPAPITWGQAEPIFIKNPVNDSLVYAYKAAKDSLDRLRLYLKAIEIRTFSSTFNDSNIALSITGEVQGEVLSLKPEYTIKSRSLVVENEDVVFRFLLGGSIQNNFIIDDINFTLGAGFQNRKGHIYRLGYLRAGGGDYLMLGMDFSIFSVKR